MSANVEAAPAWNQELDRIQSKGATTARPGSLAKLHVARQQHRGQFFTPPALVAFIWRLMDASLRRTDADARRRLAVFDNSCGTGRMFGPADPEAHTLYGCDIDGDAIEALSSAASAAGFDATFVNAGMEEIHRVRADVAIINPPFGLTLQSPFLTPFDGITHHGRLGPDTSALSQHYALAQALRACAVVFAVVPEGQVDAILALSSVRQRCRAIFRLPSGLFEDQGTAVRVSLLAFKQDFACQEIETFEISSLSAPAPDLELKIARTHQPREPRVRSIDGSSPQIVLPVTGDKRVTLFKSGRRIGLRFRCGLVEAKVRNAVLRARINHSTIDHRLPDCAKYTGQAWLDIEHLLVSENPAGMLGELARMIEAAGGAPIVDPTLSNYYRRRVASDKVRNSPMRRWVKQGADADLFDLPDGQRFAATANFDQMALPSLWGSPFIPKGSRFPVRVKQTEKCRLYAVEVPGLQHAVELTQEELLSRFTPDMPKTTGWKLLHPGRRYAFPELAKHRVRLAESHGLRATLHWDAASNDDCYQFDDVVEISMAPGGIVGWEPACGKSRAAIALCLMGGQRNVIVCESHVVPEIVTELEKIGLSQQLWQVIESPEAVADLRKVNIISYARLRQPLRAARRRETYARALRRRVHTVVADEGHILSNRESQQARALWMISPKRRYAMTGTPIPNYCRDALPLLLWAAGDGRSYQVYGDRAPYVDKVNLSTMEVACRGIDVFRDRFVTLEWAVQEFTEDLRSGAKREVPRLRNVGEFRAMLAPHMLRRVLGEPEVERWIRVPVPTSIVHTIEWDPGHLRQYLRTSWSFAAWYRDTLRASAEAGKNVNLIALLAHITEVCNAANVPHRLKLPNGAYGPMTSKQRYAVDMLEATAKQGRKSLLFATNPDAMHRMAAELSTRGIKSVMYTGDIPIKRRTRELNRQFRKGDAMVAFVSFGAGTTGLNLPQASRVFFYNRFWTPKTEHQAGRRVVRPQQEFDVEFHYLHLKGGIDEYQAQMVAQKADAISAGVDYDDQFLGEQEFLHLDTILGRFCSDLQERYGTPSRHDLLEVLEHAA